MKHFFKLLSAAVLSIMLTAPVSATVPNGTYNVTSYGAKGNGKTDNTAAINKAVSACEQAGGGQVIVPKGVFMTGTVKLKSNVQLYLEEGAVLKGINDLSAYASYIPVRQDLQKFGSAYRAAWNRALILAIGISNSSISGKGIIDGSHVEDPEGEENMRGPHAIIFGECRNFTIRDITVNNAGNYAFMGYALENASFENLLFNEGWDGIHIRGGKNIDIRNCEFHTGDDAIAGGYWENTVISECLLNSSCNGIRIIMPAVGLEIAGCKFEGPGKYPHRTSKERRRTNMLSGIILQPGGWGKAPGYVDRVYMHDLVMDNMNSPIMILLNEGNDAGDILVERVRATNINMSGYSVESWQGGTFANVTFRDIYTEFKGSSDPKLKELTMGQPRTDSREIPFWAFYANNTQNMTLENVEFKYTGTEIRPAMCFERINTLTLNKVDYKEVPGVEGMVFRRTTVVDRK